jgi:hypothetical protein
MNDEVLNAGSERRVGRSKKVGNDSKAIKDLCGA